jgi:hypothetical protein
MPLIPSLSQFTQISWLLSLTLLIFTLIIQWYFPPPPRPDPWERAPTPTTQSQPEPPKPAPPLKLPRTPYNEDEIVNLMKDLYQTFLRLNYIKRWEVIWPPKGTGHAIIEALCREIGLDQAVISLMKQLPYIKGSLVSMDIEVYQYSRAMVYLEDDEIRGGRDPTFFYFQEPRLDYLLPHEIVLICDHDEGSHIILDIKESKAHPLSPPNQLPRSYPLCVSLSLPL